MRASRRVWYRTALHGFLPCSEHVMANMDVCA